MSAIKKLLSIVACTLALVGCGNDSPKEHKSKKSASQLQKAAAQFRMMKEKRLRNAVQMLVANVSNLQNAGGYQMWTASKMAKKLILISSTAGKALPGETKIKTTEISYAINMVTKPWQIVLVPDDHKKQIVIKGYASKISKPLFSTSVKVSTY